MSFFRSFFVLIFTCLLIVCLLSSCTERMRAMEILQDEGYSKITITGYDIFGCEERNGFHTGFLAEKNGRVVRGVVCESLLYKGATVKLK